MSTTDDLLASTAPFTPPSEPATPREQPDPSPQAHQDQLQPTIVAPVSYEAGSQERASARHYPDEEHDAFSVSEFCRRHAISRGTFYNLLKKGLGPDVMRIGTRQFISREAAKRWRKEREATPIKVLTRRNRREG